jgi:DNA gyrase subunit A
LKLVNTIKEAFSGYAAMTIQQRAITDVRDNIKPSARMCFFAQKEAKIDSSHTIQPSPASVGECIKNYYLHGDSSCYKLLARYGKEYVMRYPLEDFHGSTGSLLSANSEAASRYTKMRLNKLGDKLFNSLEKETIDIWFDNFSNTKKFPSVLPSLGFYNIVNGSTGISTGISSSIPQFNLKETNEAMIKLLYNPDIPFDEIYCPPDFISGGVILNEKEVKESLRHGSGKSCCIRSVIDYDEAERILIVREIPFGVFTNTICGEIKELIDNGELVGIDKVLDLTKVSPNIKIYLSKNANYQRVLKTLYKKTSLQSYYGINMVMLDGGTKPKVFGWKEALQAHLDHEISVRTKAHRFDLKAINKRLNIIAGLLIAIANINEVVSLIRESNDKGEAKVKLIERFGYNEEQVEAILKMTLSRLIHLEIQSFNDEKEKLLKEQEYHNNILSNKKLLYKEIEDDLREVAKVYSDERRTKVINLDFTSDDEDAEPIEQKELLINYTNMGNFYTMESTTLITQRRGAKGKKLKMKPDEVSVFSLADTNYSNILVFTNKGKMYQIPASEIPIGRVHYSQLLDLTDDEIITTIISTEKKNAYKYLLFITKNGMIKKSESKLYNSCSKRGLAAIKLKEGDEVLNVCLINDEKIGILTKKNNFLITDSDSVEAIGRQSTGVKGIKLQSNDYVIDAKAIPNNSTNLVAATRNGLIKKTLLSEYHSQGRATMGNKISKVKDDDYVIKFLTTDKDCDIIIIGNEGTVKINTKEISLVSKNALGVKGTNQEITNLLKVKS